MKTNGAWIRENRERWGDRDFMQEFARGVNPHLAADPEELTWFVWQGRLALSPTAAADFVRLGMEIDIIDILSSIRVPTLVLHTPDASENATQGIGPARIVAERIRDARTLALRSDRSSPFSTEAAEAIIEFLGGEVAAVVPDTVLATVLFTDLVGSTERAAALGDRAWRDLLTRHHADVRRELAVMPTDL